MLETQSAQTLSIVIPCHNEESFIAQLLTSIENHIGNYANKTEIIVVDNCSTDKTHEVVYNFAKKSKLKIKICLEPILGVSRAKNRGASHASSEYLLFLDADLTLSENFWDATFSLIQQNVGVATTRLYANQTESVRGKLLFKTLELIKTKVGRPFGKFLILKDLFHEIGGFDTNIKLGENAEILLRAQKKCTLISKEFKHIKAPLFCSLRRFEKEGYIPVLGHWLSAYLGKWTHDYKTMTEIHTDASYKQRPRLTIFFLAFNHEDSMKGLTKLSQLLQTALVNFEPKMTIIDNSRDQIFAKMYPECAIPGDNEYNDFSGWQVAWKEHQKNILPNSSDWVLFVNDSFHKNFGSDYLHNLTTEAIAKAVKNKSVIGYIDDFPKPASLLGLDYQKWIRSSFFACPENILNHIKDLRFPVAPEDVFSKNSNEFWADNNDISSKNFRAYISSWLFGEKNPDFPEYSLSWYKADKLNMQNKEFFKRKALAILSEHYLGARILNASPSIINLNSALADYPGRHTEDYYEQQKKHQKLIQ